MGAHVNEVRLIGRISGEVVERELPSGTLLTSFSVVIDRPPREIHGRTKIDTIACQTSRPAVAAKAARSEAGQCVEVFGSLRRRFWRGASGLASATEVEVSRLRIFREGSSHGAA